MCYPISSCLHKFQIAFVFRLKFIFKSSSGLHSFASCISFELYLLRPSICPSVWTESHLKTGRRHLSNITDSTASLWHIPLSKSPTKLCKTIQGAWQSRSGRGTCRVHWISFSLSFFLMWMPLPPTYAASLADRFRFPLGALKRRDRRSQVSNIFRVSSVNVIRDWYHQWLSWRHKLKLGRVVNLASFGRFSMSNHTYVWTGQISHAIAKC